MKRTIVLFAAAMVLLLVSQLQTGYMRFHPAIPPGPAPTTGLMAAYYHTPTRPNYVDSAGATPGYWVDSSGNGRTLRGQSSAESPASSATGVHFDGSNDWLLSDVAFLQGTEGLAIPKCYVMKMVIDTAKDCNFLGIYGAGGASIWLGADKNLTISYGIDLPTTNAPFGVGTHVIAMVINGTSSQIWKDGVLQRQGNTTGANFGFTRMLMVGKYNGGGYFFDGKISGLLVYETIPSNLQDSTSWFN